MAIKQKNAGDAAAAAGEKAKAAFGWASGMAAKFIAGEEMMGSGALRSNDSNGEGQQDAEKKKGPERLRPFTETGAGQLDVDLTALQHFFGGHTTKSLRRAFVRLNQVRAVCPLILLPQARPSSRHQPCFARWCPT